MPPGAAGGSEPPCSGLRWLTARLGAQKRWAEGTSDRTGAPSHPDRPLVPLRRSQLQTSASYGPVLSPMNKVHGGGINKLPSVNQLVGQAAQHGPGSAPGLAPMGELLRVRGAALRDGGARSVMSNGSVHCIDTALPGPGMLNSHTMQPNGEMNGGHSSQSMVSGSHCTPPPPYNPDPSLVR